MSTASLSEQDRSRRALCHPDGQKSCGACCGMYNHRQTAEPELMARLRHRTEAFRREASIDDAASLRAFRQKWEDPPEVKLLGELASCPFLGLLDGLDTRGRVGCLVHPLQNDGVDGRDCGVYDRHTCEDYLCAAHAVLKREEVNLVLAAVPDSYLYGLVITNPRLIRTFFELAATERGAYPQARELSDPAVVAAAAEFFSLVRSWPYRAADGIFGSVVPGEGLETHRRAHPAGEGLRQPVDTLLIGLGTRTLSQPELADARGLLLGAVSRFARALG
ncbi:hypothetical protein DL240_12210 [Lujinxingia litoralis]|uniref:Uncharacterized protein n=1 Tax=Lujinxingia litoralis TaxID=2211119 RepID=A0A328C3K5_9DELT|nr:hypothetical protein [Lujinxingia litoralis]RAL21614.1 hypothetical protein DL240_12210 [Lujinxingia litoralis]